MTEEQTRVQDLIRKAFQGVTLGHGIGLFQGRALDDHSDARAIAESRVRDEKQDWSAISPEDLNKYHSSISFFDVEGMTFHLPAYLIADLQGTLKQDILFHLIYPEGFWRFEILSDLQRKAVSEFLHLRLSDYDSDFERAPIETAPAEYWMLPKKNQEKRASDRL